MNGTLAQNRQWLGIIGIIFGAFMAVLDVQIVNTCLSDIAASLDTAPEKASWLMTAYLTAEVVAIPLIGVLVHNVGLRKVVLAVIILFAAFSLACANAWNFSSMVVFRSFQGLAGGTLIPLALTSIMTLLPQQQRTTGMACFAIAATCAPTLGPALGGWLAETWGWRWIFLINIPPALLLIAMVAKGIPAAAPAKKHTIHGTGLLLILPGLAALEIFLEEGNSHNWFETPWITACGIIALIGIVLFCLTEYRARHPLINLKLLNDHRVHLCCWAVFGLGMALYGSIFLITQYHALVQGFSPGHIANVLLWMGIPQLMVLPFMPRLLKTINADASVIAGFLLFLTGTLLSTPLTSDFAGEHFYINQIIRAIGQPFIFVPLSVLITRHVPDHDAPSASMLVDVFLAIGGATGIAVLSTVLERRMDLHYHNLREVAGMNSALLNELNNLRMDTIDPLSATQLLHTVNEQAAIMAYSDGFFLIAGFIVFCIACIVMTLIPIGSRSRNQATPTAKTEKCSSS
ncbi:DHA2 family efflux MFS transporter permease subunit [Kistimonas asteriae]|uniref:DHA2 family efflux MFS transporter permease subunit n=1 Tax=Kistimonas asteriae TaxID=517724 RepID=UPI001BABD050|nr:DHA2 family efflux MFS transporter permease subunit [Kistimonas asteriae]